jgi:hypothetical protein
MTNLLLLLPPGNPLRLVAALLFIGLLPGLGWVHFFAGNLSLLMRWTTATALSYTFTCLTILFLHYLPGPIQTWPILILLNSLAILPALIHSISNRFGWICSRREPSKSIYAHIPIPLFVILLISLFLRLANLDYSEFQGDEALVMISAAEALEGHEDALLLRSKGPAEVLLPIALWRLTGVVTELAARLPFTLAALLAIVTIYLIGQTIGGERLGWLAAGFFALNGFMVAFGRIVQYQALVIWFSALAFCLLLQWRQTRQNRFAFLGGLSLGVGLLAHYDAILVLPAIIWLFIPPELAGFRPKIVEWFKNRNGLLSKPTTATNHLVAQSLRITHHILHACRQNSRLNAQALLLFLVVFSLTSLSFYLPYTLDPQANRTSEYLGNRIGQALRNNLPDFLHFNTFYSSTYYLVITALLVLGFLAWLLWQARWGRWPAAGLGIVAILAVTLNPQLLTHSTMGPDLTFLPFAVVLLAAFLVLPLASNWQLIIVWLAVPFLGYNFIVAVGLTHIYTIIPAWSLLAAAGWQHLIDSPFQNLASPWPSRISYGFLGAGLALSSVFLWNSFIRHDVEYWQDYPQANLWFYWDPYQNPPQAGFFGFAHRAGWKAIGQKIVTGELAGDYGSNEEPDVTTWYTRGAPRACDPQPEFYFLANDLIDPVNVPADIITTGYQQIGAINLANQRQTQIMQLKPTWLNLGSLDEPTLAHEFDKTAVPIAFARSARGSQTVQANFDNLVQLIGYDLDTRRAWPGGRIPITLYWQALRPIPASYQVFTHLESELGPIAQADGVPVCWTYPTNLWRPGQIIADQHAIVLPPDILPGNYPLEIGFYLPDTFERLNVLDLAGNPAGTSVILTTVELEE